MSALPHARAPHATGGQEWEQGRRRPESAVRAYLTVIDRNPEVVEKALVNKPPHVSSNLPKKFTRS